MDKKTIQVVIVCMVALFGLQLLVNKIWPPVSKRLKPVATNAVAAVAQANAPTQVEGAAPVAPPVIEKPVAGLRPPEQIVVLSNALVRVEFTNYGGGIRSVELLQHRSNEGGSIVLNRETDVPALMIDGDTNAVFAIEQPQPNTVVMRASGVTKQFALGTGYLLTGKVDVTGGGTNLPLVIGMVTPASVKEPIDLLSACWLMNTKFRYADLKHLRKGEQQETGALDWAAVKNQFFTMILTPATNAVAVRCSEINLPIPDGWTSKLPPAGVTATLDLAPSAQTATSREYAFTYYAGPKQYDRLLALGNGQEEVMQFGIWGFISVWLLKGMTFFYGLIPNYGVAIIIITLIIKIIFWPIQAKSIRSMKEMQKFQPLMAKLKEKYKDDQARMNQEMMKLYKEHKINPLSGCLPMVVQIPVFFAWYTMLRNAIELRGAHFLWIKDLSQPDTLAHIAGFPLNPLPLAMGVSMIGQMKLTPQSGDMKQQQIMMWFMPAFFLFICYNMSSGLVLYWTVQQLLSIAQQWWSLRKTAPATPQPA